MTDAEFLRTIRTRTHLYGPVFTKEEQARLQRLAERMDNIPGYVFCNGCGELFPDDELDPDYRECETCVEERGFWETAPGGSRG